MIALLFLSTWNPNSLSNDTPPAIGLIRRYYGTIVSDVAMV
jgi:hypothetical protein